MKRVLDIVKHPLFSGSFLMIFGSMSVNIVNYTYHLIMGRILGPIDYGTLASIYSILYIVTIIPQSASISVVKFISSAKKDSDRSRIYWSINNFVFKLALFLSVILLFLSKVISDFLNIHNVFLIILVAPILFFSVVSLVNMSALQGVLKFSGVVLPSLVSAVLKLILGVLLVILGYSVTGAVWGVVIAAAISYVVTLTQIKSISGVKFKGYKYKLDKFLKYSFPVLLQSLAFTSIFTSDLILVKHFLSPFDAGIYASLSTLGKIIFFASSPIAGTMFPIISGRNSRGESYTKIIFTSIFLTVCISFGVSLIYLLFPGLSITLLYGSKFLEASGNLFAMGIFMSFYSISYLLTNYYLSLGDTKKAYWAIAAAVIQIIAILIWHGSIRTVILNSMILMGILTLVLSGFLRYNLGYAKRKES